MARRFSKSQLQSKLRQIQNKQRQAIGRFKQAVRKANSAVNNYNREVRAHNARVRSNRQRLRQELNRLHSRSSTKVTYYTSLRTSVRLVHDAYERYETRFDDTPEHALSLDLAEQEDANSVAVMNALLDEGEDVGQADAAELEQTKITDELRVFSDDLHARWEGALYALSPRNPDACRQFCTSSREIITHLINLRAPVDDVLTALPSCEKDDKGRPTRAAKLRYVLIGKGMAADELETFAEANIKGVLELFQELSSGTHGQAGKFGLPQLLAIKTRVEDNLLWMSHILS